MNRLVLIGNGFDLAHGLPTRYEDFINWYWDQRMYGFNNDCGYVSEDLLCRFRILHNKNEELETWSTLAYANNYFRPVLGKVYVGKDIIATITADKEHYETTFFPFFERIIKSIETKGWVDIENEYYYLLTRYAFPQSIYATENNASNNIKILNQRLDFLKGLLVQYLQELTEKKPNRISSIEEAIFSPFNPKDLSTAAWEFMQSHITSWSEQSDAIIKQRLELFGIKPSLSMMEVKHYRENNEKGKNPQSQEDYPAAFMLPNNIMFLNFNYTHTAQIYNNSYKSIEEIHIHGDIDEGNSVIFGYGDELHSDFQKLKEKEDNECLRNVKSIRYLDAANYKNALRFMESAPFQVLIMGHSCGTSDRTLLNTIFEHRNCVSIKPYYYKKEDGTDNYQELIQNISRNFTDMKLMRDRVVNKTQCEPLVKE